ncbi:Di-copper centre-containing protein [Coprinopsis marcescibilis]|uniref:Di-copper centre-containing protein n=1 Tax=Coprinopsis marcescibilis TaxID=230819 RepID=A0A5C3KN46_COPMA|nr:Di-copper centre-containing protein [Coprinopsis marcescibilis]
MVSFTAALLSLALGFFASSVVAVPAEHPVSRRAPCSQIDVHKEWRDLTTTEKADYIRAVKCLMTTPPREQREAVTNRYEEFQATHILLTERVHSVGHFLPWHRHLNNLYHGALRNECGYTGPFTFWDWSRDADSTLPLKNSPIFDPNTGFGGDGVPGTYKLPPDPKGESFTNVGNYKGCIGDGPFKGVMVHRGPGKLITTHCIVRGIDESWRRGVVSSNVNNIIQTSATYERFRLTIDDLMRGHIHGSGHGIVGGEMLNIYSAGADPLFYLHHANLDRVWWKWQNANPSQRTYELSGPTTQQGKIQITLDFMMDFPALGPNITVRDVMDASQSPSCFKYAY